MDESYLNIIEAAHRERVGEFRFCYVATEIGSNVWRLSIVERYQDGHFPVSDDYFVGTEQEAKRRAAELNLTRLGLDVREAALMVASSMVGTLDDARSHRYSRGRR